MVGQEFPIDVVKIYDSMCAWIDLLGYGNAFYSSDWDLNNPKAISNIYRIQKLESSITSILSPFNETVFLLNDGIIRNYDIPKNNAFMIMQWLINVIITFKYINDNDINNGYYGARGVVEFGTRAQYRKTDSVGMGDLIQTSEDNRYEYNKKRVIYSPSELQMNTAFSKAYIIESGGSSAGLKKNRIHLDEKMLVKLAGVINEIEYDEFGLTEEDNKRNGPCVFHYNAILNRREKELVVKAKTNEVVWTCLKIDFGEIISYKNDEKSLTTCLFVPQKIHCSLFSPYNEEVFEVY